MVLHIGQNLATTIVIKLNFLKKRSQTIFFVISASKVFIEECTVTWISKL